MIVFRRSSAIRWKIRNNNNIKANKLDQNVLIHGHCHQKSQDRMKGLTSLLSELNINNKMIDSSCCGMAGSFGYNKETYEVSIKMAMTKLIPSILKYKNPTVIADGTSCRAQIKDQSEIKAVHIANFLEPLIIQKINES